MTFAWLPCALLGVLLPALRAEAIPAFARKYNVSCGTCHAPAYPELNPNGRRFQEEGLQYPEGAEPAYRERNTLAPGTALERIGLWREVPLSFRITGSGQVPTSAQASGRSSVNLRLVDNLYLVGGGSPYPDVSVIFSTSLAPAAMLHHASVGFHDLLFGDGVLNLRAGQLLLFDFLHPEHRSITKIGNLAATTKVGLNPTQLDTSHLGADIYGRVAGRALFYQLAVFQGAQGPDGLSDLDSFKDLFGQLQLTIAEQQVFGIFGSYGRTQLTSETRQVVVRFSDPVVVAGADVELHLGPVNFFGYGLYGRHGNAYGTGRSSVYYGGRAELSTLLRRDLLALVRFDGVFSPTVPSLERQVATAHLSYLVLTNFKLSAEFQAELKSFNRSTAYALLDVAL